MTAVVVICTESGDPAATTALARRLMTLAGGDHTRVATGHGGFVVDAELAAAHLTVPAARPVAPAAGTPLPPALAATAAAAEDRAGIRRPRSKTTSSQGVRR